MAPPVLDPTLCYRAVTSRDRRFDGRFFTAVQTTGIYCRPICPAKAPLLKNVTFYACAAAAEAAGFRPCRRCRPDAAPGTPVWNGTEPTVARGLRLIQQGALDQGDVPSLSARLGIGERHLHRLFVEHLGTPPSTIAKTRRVHFARRLIDHTDLPMSRIALDSGFSSVRRFNGAIQECFKQSPTELRQAARRAGTSAREGWIELRLSYRPPLDWASLLAFLIPRCTPNVEWIEGKTYHRTVRFGRTAGVLEVEPVPRGSDALVLRAPVALSPHIQAIVEGMRDLFDLRADPAGIARSLKSDPLLKPAFARPKGLRVPGAWDGFELGVRAILGQQVSVKGATTLAGRVAERFGRPFRFEGTRLLTFPTAKALSHADLTDVGMPASRGRAINALAQAVSKGLSLNPAADPAQTREALCALPGIGEWTADYVCMRALSYPDAFPAGDLGLRKALSEGKKPMTTRQIDERSQSWRPWRAYAAMALWQSLS